jgi:carbamoyltransferase
MAVLGISGRDRDAAAALAVDGRLVSAATEDSFARVPGIGYAQTGGFPRAAVEACLDIAGLSPREVTDVVIVDEGSGQGVVAGSTRQFAAATRVSSIDAVQADALQAAGSDPDSSTVVVLTEGPPGLAVFRRENSGLGGRIDIDGAPALLAEASRLAAALGLGEADPLGGLDRLSLGADPEVQHEFGKAVAWNHREPAVVAAPGAFAAIVKRVAGEHVSSLADGGSLNARVQHARRVLAASFTAELASVVARVVEHFSDGRPAGPVAVGGGAFGNARLNTELAKIAGGRMSFSAVPEATGRAIGAAGAAADGLDVGPAYSEEAIKRTLDNCRLDYVYEPDWPRLLSRVSKMLAQGKIVGWFQGAMTFGPRSLGARSILADPSHRYVRQNVNEYLRGLPVDEPLPVAFAPSLRSRCLSAEAPPARGVFDALVRDEWRSFLTAALDWRQGVRVHGATAPASRLGELLELHLSRTGTPGLIETNLAGPGEPVACTPRDAVRTAYSSAIDALVIGRFLLMKDYWLLRTQE